LLEISVGSGLRPELPNHLIAAALAAGGR
jgi:hypothetical protein